MGRPPVLRDVAALAGVSAQTVSRVVNAQPYVRPQTRARVLAAMRVLGYQPNVAARTLVCRRSRRIGLLTYDTVRSFLVYALEGAAGAAGYHVSIAGLPGLDAGSVRDALARLDEQAVEGIIVLAPVAATWAEMPPGVPVVVTGAADRAGVPVVAVDNAYGGELATRHLLDLGHRTVHHLAGPVEWPEAAERQAGWRAALESAGRPVPEPARGDWSARSGYLAGRRLAADPAVTAVFCGNDAMAVGVLRALSEAGRAVPGDVSVAGFDDVPEAPYLRPPLTSVRQDFAALGRHSVDLLLAQITTGVRATTGRRCRPQLIVRESTAAPPREWSPASRHHSAPPAWTPP